MPQAIPAIAAAAKAAFAYVASASTAVAAGTATLAQYATVLAVNAAVAVASNALFRPQVPDQDFARSVRKQSIPDRVSGYGRVRLGGAYMCYEAIGEFAYCVYAMHDGLIDGFETLYLNDRPEVVTGGYVARGADGRYGGGGNLVRIDTRRGFPTETRYAEVDIPTSIWDANARGDGVASMLMRAKVGNIKYFLGDYPNGLPQPSRVARLQLCWDARLGERGTIVDDDDKDASPTWAWTQNPVWQLLDYMTNPSTGMGLDVAMFLPRIEDWIVAADACDEDVAGTPRYQAGGVYTHSTAPADVIAALLASFDGWMTQDGQGAFTVQAGKYYEPTVVITDADIIALSRQFFVEDERAINEMVVSFTDPAFDYAEVESDPIRNEFDIMDRGEVRSQRLALPWVQNNKQAQRLGKIALSKASAPISGTVTTTLAGLAAFAERRIRIQAPSDSEVMADIVVEIAPLTLNPDMTVSIPFKSVDENAYEDGTTGEGPGDIGRPDLEPIPDPVILDAIAFFDDPEA